MNILLGCAAGMSTSMLVLKMRIAAEELGYDQCKIASIEVGKIPLYMNRVDMILLAPQVTYSYEQIKALADQYDIPVFIISQKDFGKLDGKSVLLKAQKQFEGLYEEEVYMDKLSQTLEKYLLPFANKLGSNIILSIVRDAMSAPVALLILGSIAILLGNFPHEGIANFLAPANPFFNTIYVCTSSAMGLLVSVTTAYYASERFKTVPITSVVTAVAAFLITQSEIVEGWPVLNTEGFGVSGMLTALVVSIVSVKVIQIFQDRNIGIKMPEGVPPAISDSFSSLFPAFTVLAIFTFLTTVLHFNINDVISMALSPLSGILNTLPGYVIYHMLCGLVFFCGINSAVVISVVTPFIIQNSIANETAYAANEAVQHVVTSSVDTMVWAGGTGATIGLVILMVFMSKSKMMKTLGRISLGPSIFNINEPIIFGVPIAFNPIMLIPFVLLPGIIAGGTYALMSAGIIGMPILGNVPWTLPPIFVGFVMSGGAMSTTIWSACIVLISIAVFYPFFRIADKQMYEKELAEEKANGANVLE